MPMLLLYNIGIWVYFVLIKLFSPFNVKAKLFIRGRKALLHKINQKVNPNEKHIWFHFASLGEFEQGRPVLERLKFIFPEKKFVVTFFSPSGYEIRKNYALADVFYLPLDTARNAQDFVAAINPEMAIFTKYEFWYHYFKCLKDKQVPLYLISGIFRKNQVFFKWYGGFYRSMLSAVSHFFVQNEASKTLLASIGIQDVTVNGDTRFDRVYAHAQSPIALPEIAAFIGQSPTLVCGSTWPEDEALLVSLAAENQEWKVIIAPHEINEAHLDAIERLFAGNCLRHSHLSTTNERHLPQVLIIDNIGMLANLYPYGKIAYVGGGFGAGIHNTLEAAAFGLAVIFGPNYQKFQEAKDLLNLGAAKSISNLKDLRQAFDQYKNNETAALTAKQYVYQQKGATEKIISLITQKMQVN